MGVPSNDTANQPIAPILPVPKEGEINEECIRISFKETENVFFPNITPSTDNDWFGGVRINQRGVKWWNQEKRTSPLLSLVVTCIGQVVPGSSIKGSSLVMVVTTSH